ncbi:MAG: thiamine-phosphate kinase [Fimbriiglobus sp.]
MSPEFAFIESLRSRQLPMGVLTGIGDDCAVLVPGSRATLVTVDLLSEGVDFWLAEAGPRGVGRKAMGVNLSDIAAMAGVPKYAVVALCLPKVDGMRVAKEVMVGVQEVAAEFGVAVVGGDTNSWDGGLVISITVMGEATERGAVRRSGAKPGDGLYITGPVGGSLLGRHLEPRPRVREALAIHQAVEIHAMIDVSDGLAADLLHILDESLCGANLISRQIPIHADAHRRAALTGRTALDHALNDGEDFELLFTAPTTEAMKLAHFGVHHIGTCTDSGLSLDGVPYVPKGWSHDLG